MGNFFQKNTLKIVAGAMTALMSIAFYWVFQLQITTAFGSVVGKYETVSITSIHRAVTSGNSEEKTTTVDAEETEVIQPLGELIVTVDEAYYRSSPEVNEESKLGTVKRDERYDYYEAKDVGGVIWYRLMYKDSTEMIWISSKTVKVVE